MSQTPERLSVLDTGVVVHLARGDKTGEYIESTYSLSQKKERPIIPSVVKGEIYAITEYNGWGKTKLDKLNDILKNFVHIDIGAQEVINSYVEIYCAARSEGRAFSNNDLWIAAITRTISAELFTCDGDFNWMNPKLINVCYVPKH